VDEVFMGIFRSRIVTGTYIIVLALIFLYLLFPADTVRGYLSYQLSQIHPAITVEIESVKPAFPPGLRLYNISFFQRQTRLGKMETATLRPGFFSLLSSGTKLAFTATSYSGTITGNARIVYNSKIASTTVKGTLSGIQLRELAASEPFSRYKLAGILDGTFKYSSDAANQNLESDIRLLDGTIDPVNPMFEVGLLKFKQVTADFKLHNQRLAINKCTLEGDQLDGELSGSVILNENSDKSLLDLNATLQPHKSLLAKMENIIPAALLKGQQGDKQGFSFKIKGTAHAPRLLLD
jgi:type II secretion system protein N